MDDLDHEITLLNANIATYNTDLNAATSPEDKRLLLEVIIETTRRLNRLLDQQAAQTSRSPANVFGIYSPPNVVHSP